MDAIQKLREMRARNERGRSAQGMPAVQASKEDARAAGGVDSVLPRVATAGEGHRLTCWSCSHYGCADLGAKCERFEYEPGSDELDRASV